MSSLLLIGWNLIQTSDRSVAANGNLPVFEVSPDKVEIGQIELHAVVKRSIQVRNRGEASLRVLGFRSGCGCLTCPSVPKEIGPRSETSLELVVDTTGFDRGGSIGQQVSFLASNGEWSEPIEVTYQVKAPKVDLAKASSE